MDYEILVKKILSEYNGLTTEEIERKIMRIAEKLSPPERVDYIKLFTVLNGMEEKGIIRREKNKYFLNI